MNTLQKQTAEQEKEGKKMSIANFLNMPSTAKFLLDTLSEKKPEFVSNLISLCDSDSSLAECDPGELMKCALNATSLNLPLNKNLGYAYVIPYKKKIKIQLKEEEINKNGEKTSTKWIEKYFPQFQIGYKGLIQLAIRTGQYRFINATEIRKDEISHNKITGEIIFHGEKPQNEISGYLAYIEMVNGFTASLYMSNEQMEEHAVRFSKMYQSDKEWQTVKSKWSDPLARPAMCKKTVLKGLLGTYGLMTTEFSKALINDSEEEAPNSGYRFTEAEIIQQDEPQNEPKDEPVQAETTKTVLL